MKTSESIQVFKDVINKIFYEEEAENLQIGQFPITKHQENKICKTPPFYVFVHNPCFWWLWWCALLQYRHYGGYYLLATTVAFAAHPHQHNYYGAYNPALSYYWK
ncbi:hypothetical protein CEXT_553131 [Caerostris extrusa]|uniref:Uncharacterized protein n=1 Tax=Caerostris extrusa TaxID=172846 RepID=A0AAV4XIK6_CAEEX|nr:hypothetical protein CEXT_553131 [Caerostris extrusa]